MKLFTFQILNKNYISGAEDVSMAEVDVFAETKEKAEERLSNFINPDTFDIESIEEQ